MHVMDWFKCFVFIFSSCFFMVGAPDLQDAVEDYAEMFEKTMRPYGPKLEVRSVDLLLEQAESLGIELKSFFHKKSKSSREFRRNFEMKKFYFTCMSDIEIFGYLKSVLPDFTNKEKLKHLYDIACSSPRYHYVMVKLIADYPEVKAMVKVFSEARAAEMAPKRVRLSEEAY